MLGGEGATTETYAVVRRREERPSQRRRWAFFSGLLSGFLRRRRRDVSTPAAFSAREEVRPVVPKLVELSETVLYGDVWERPGLSKRDRSLVTVAALTAMSRSDQLAGHLERALANGVTREEIGELITHLAFYAGWPAAMTAGRIARKVFDGARP